MTQAEQIQAKLSRNFNTRSPREFSQAMAILREAYSLAGKQPDENILNTDGTVRSIRFTDGSVLHWSAMIESGILRFKTEMSFGQEKEDVTG